MVLESLDDFELECLECISCVGFKGGVNYGNQTACTSGQLTRVFSIY